MNTRDEDRVAEGVRRDQTSEVSLGVFIRLLTQGVTGCVPIFKLDLSQERAQPVNALFLAIRMRTASRLFIRAAVKGCVVLRSDCCSFAFLSSGWVLMSPTVLVIPCLHRRVELPLYCVQGVKLRLLEG